MAFWFGRKSAPERHPLVPAWLQSEAETGGFARGYEAQLDQVYRRNPVGLRAVRLVAGLVGGLPTYVDDGPGEAVELIRSDGLLERRRRRCCCMATPMSGWRSMAMTGRRSFT